MKRTKSPADKIIEAIFGDVPKQKETRTLVCSVQSVLDGHGVDYGRAIIIGMPDKTPVGEKYVVTIKKK